MYYSILRRLFAARWHRHTNLSPTTHDHDADYADIAHSHPHDHDADYADINHSHAGEALVGQIIMFGSVAADVPSGWAICNGATLEQDCPYRTMLINAGYPFGLDEQSGACGIVPCPLLPNLVGRFPLGAGTVGAVGGEAAHTLTVGEMPSHTHNVKLGFIAGSGSSRVTEFINGTFEPDLISSSGGSQAHNNMPPYVEVLFIVFLG